MKGIDMKVYLIKNKYTGYRAYNGMLANLWNAYMYRSKKEAMEVANMNKQNGDYVVEATLKLKN